MDQRENDRTTDEHRCPVDVVAERGAKVPDARSAVICVVVRLVVLLGFVVVVIVVMVVIVIVIVIVNAIVIVIVRIVVVMLGEVDDRIADVDVIGVMEGG